MKKTAPFARKRFGQHFLTDQNVIFKAVAAANITSDDHLIEIGPGRGALTEKLIETDAKLSVIEIDRDLADLLEEDFGDRENFNLIRSDVLKLDWNDTFIHGEEGLKMVANLPYNISTPLFFQFVKYRQYFESFTVMVQKEVALRMVNDGTGKNIKDYGILSVVSANCFDVEWVCDVPAGSFNPPPKVESAVIKLIPKNIPESDLGADSNFDEEKFFRFVQRAFNQRRKVITSFLKTKEKELYESLSLEVLEKLKNVRPENLSPVQYLTLYRDGKL